MCRTRTANNKKRRPTEQIFNNRRRILFIGMASAIRSNFLLHFLPIHFLLLDALVVSPGRWQKVGHALACSRTDEAIEINVQRSLLHDAGWARACVYIKVPA